MPAEEDDFDPCDTCNSEATCRWQGACMCDLEEHGFEDDDFDIPEIPDDRELRAIL